MKMKIKYSKNQNMYILQAGFEYLLSLLVTGSFLATLTKQLGMSDSLTGIIASFISLGSLFQLLSLFLRGRRFKPTVIVLSVVNQLLFLLLYIVPLGTGSRTAKSAVFVVLIFTAYIVYYLIHPKKINWMMSNVDDHHRGSFTADKEVISLLAGMAFSFSMGALIDHFVAVNQIRTAFIISAVVMFVLLLLQTLSLIFTDEPLLPEGKKKNLIAGLRDLFNNKSMLCVMVVSVLYFIITHSASPFFSTYQLSELGFNLKLVTALTMLGSASRILVSKFWGNYADKKSFAKMFEKCLFLLAVSFFCVFLATPENGKITFALYYIFHGAALGGANSALMNMVFDYAKVETRADSLAVCQAVSGIVGFLSTLAISPLISHIQQNGNRFLGLPLYAQQVAALITVLIIIVTIIFVHTVMLKQKKAED